LFLLQRQIQRMTILKNKPSNLIIGIVAFLLFCVLFFFLGYGNVFFAPPSGIHYMRQTDSLSFANQYYNNGFSFFNPQLYNLKNTDAKAACEFPITYYITALFYNFTGTNFWMLKLLHLSISFAGVFFIFKLAYHWIQDYVYALLITLFLFTSTVFNYYAFNYLPDTAALGFTFIGWYYIFKYFNIKERKSLFLSLLFFTIGSLIKVTYFINPMAIIVFSIFLRFSKSKAILEKKQMLHIIKFGALSLMIVVLWNIYVIYYNKSNESTSFNTSILPIWDLSSEGIIEVLLLMKNYWYVSYFAHASFHLILVLFIIAIIFYKKIITPYFLLLLILFLGNICYFLLFFKQFKDHDYYAFAFLPLIVMFMILVFQIIKNKFTNKYLTITLKVIFAIIIVTGINYSSIKLNERHAMTYDVYSKAGNIIYKNMESINKLGIKSDTKVIIAPEPSQNGGLLFLNKKGWTIASYEAIQQEKINELKDKGAKYLFLVKDDEYIFSLDFF
jgi:hypothetical protein